MLNTKIHFLDTNILLGKILPDDNKYNYKICNLYFGYDFKRYISENVELESEKVLNRLRRVSSKIYKYFLRYDLQNINPLKIENHINTIKNSFLKEYDGESYPENIKHNKFIGIVKDLFNWFYEEFKDVLFVNTDESFKNLKETITSTFRKANEDLKSLISTLEKSKNNSSENTENFEENLNDKDLHKADIYILLDCYNTFKNLKDIVAFITQDKVILQRKEDINNIFDINFPIYFPNDYISI